MTGVLQAILEWFLKKFGGGLVIVLLGVGSTGLWLYLRESLDFEEKRSELLRLVTGEQAHLQQAREQSEARRKAYVGEREILLGRIQQASRAIIALEDLDSTWEKLFGDRARQKEYAARRNQLSTTRMAFQRRADELERLALLETYTLDGLDLALGKLERKKAGIDEKRSAVGRYLHEAWEEVRWHVLGAFALWLLGPLILSAALYYLLAPWITRRRSLRLKPLMSAMPELSESKAALDLPLAPGSLLRVKERYLQASDEELNRSTRLLFDWKLPLTSLACGLTEMSDLRHSGPEGHRHVTLSDTKDPLNELCLITLPEGASIILRPHCVAGLVMPGNGQVEIRRHWVFSRWQSWVTLQFRHFEFRGPLGIVLAGGRGVRIERLDTPDRPAGSSRRVNSGSLLGFTPNLEYKPVRAETFWAFYRGQNPLFDDLFSGPGLFLCQASGQDKKTGHKFWSGLGRGLLKVIGL